MKARLRPGVEQLCLLLLAALGALASGPCSNPYTGLGRVPCGTTVWKCDIQRTPCHRSTTVKVCAPDLQSAIAAGNKKAIEKLKPTDQDLQGTTCEPTDEKDTPL